MTDIHGRPYAKLSELKTGSVIELDSGFDCAKGKRIVFNEKGELYFHCSHGKHFLDGQADDGEHCIGVYHVV